MLTETLNIINDLDRLYNQAAKIQKNTPDKDISEQIQQASILEKKLLGSWNEEARPLLQQIIYYIKSAHGFPSDNPGLTFENYHEFDKYRSVFQPNEAAFIARYQYFLCLCKLAYFEERNGIPEEHAFKLALFFDSDREALKNLITFMSQKSNLTKEEEKGKTNDEIEVLKAEKASHEFTLHNACLLGLPSPTSDWETWRKHLKKDFLNKELRNLLSVAEDIEELIKKNTTENQHHKVDLKLIKEKTEDLRKLNSAYKASLGKQDTKGLSREEKLKAKSDLAKLAEAVSEKRIEIYRLSAGLPFSQYSLTQLMCCAEVRKQELADNYLLKNGLSKAHAVKFNSLNRNEAGREIPDVKVDGAEYGCPGIYLMKVDTSDTLQASRAAIIGMLTGCCQSIGNVGEPCAIHGLTSPYGGFYVVCQGDINDPKVEDPLLGACWVWRSETGALCYDSIETNHRNDKAVINLFAKLSIKLVSEGQTHRITCGARSGISHKLGLIPSLFISEHPRDYSKYRDSHEQRLVYDKELAYLFYKIYDFAKKDTEDFIKKCLSSQTPLHENIPFCIMLNQLLLNDETDLLEYIKNKAKEYGNIDNVSLIIDKVLKFSNDEMTENEILDNPENYFLLATKKGNGETLLHSLVKKRQTEGLKKLLTQKNIAAYSINSYDLKGFTPLHRAIADNSIEIIELLIALEANINQKDSDSNTPLMLAIKHQNNSLALYLMNLKEVNLDMDDEEGNHPIMKAIELGLTDIALELIERGAIIDEANISGVTVLQHAAFAGDLTIFKELFKRLPLEHINLKHEAGFTALTLAIINGKDQITKFLAEKLPADALNQLIPSGKDKGHTPVTWAILYGKTEIAVILAEKLPPEALNAVISDGVNIGETPLNLAIKYGRYDIAKILIEKLPAETLNKVIPDGKYKWLTPLTWAFTQKEINIAKILIEKLPAEVLNQIIPYGNDTGHSALTLAILDGKTEIAKILLEKLPPEALNAVISDGVNIGETPLTLAIKYANNDITKILIKKLPAEALNQAFATGKDKGHTPLTFAIKNGNIEIAKILIENLPAETLNQVIPDGIYKGLTPLTCALTESRITIAKILIKKLPAGGGLNQVIPDRSGRGATPLTWAISQDDVTIAKILIEKLPAEALNQVIPDGIYKGLTPLGWAVKNNYIEIVNMLIQRLPADKLNPIIRDIHNEEVTPLTWAMKYGITETARILVEKLPAEALSRVFPDGHYKSLTPLTSAILLGNNETAKILVEKLPAEALNHVIADGYYKGSTALTLAIVYGKTEIAKILVKRLPAETLNQVIPDAFCKGHTALTLANVTPNMNDVEEMINHKLNSAISESRPSPIRLSQPANLEDIDYKDNLEKAILSENSDEVAKLLALRLGELTISDEVKEFIDKNNGSPELNNITNQLDKYNIDYKLPKGGHSAHKK